VSTGAAVATAGAAIAEAAIPTMAPIEATDNFLSAFAIFMIHSSA
jgi:hypothetical protein